MNKVVIRGPVGSVMWGYHVAGSIGSWSISTHGAESVLTGTVTQADPYRLSQPALRFRVDRQNGTPWVWALTELHIADGTLRAHVTQE